MSEDGEEKVSHNQNILIGVLGESTRIISKLRKYFNVFHEVNNFVWLVWKTSMTREGHRRLRVNKGKKHRSVALDKTTWHGDAEALKKYDACPALQFRLRNTK